jgi:FixJ family two-component response regulator
MEQIDGMMIYLVEDDTRVRETLSHFLASRGRMVLSFG